MRDVAPDARHAHVRARHSDEESRDVRGADFFRRS
jgi:hypothetical protein